MNKLGAPFSHYWGTGAPGLRLGHRGRQGCSDAAIQAKKDGRDAAIAKANDERVQQEFQQVSTCKLAGHVAGIAAYDDCIHFVGPPPEEKILLAYDRGRFCQKIYPEKSPNFQNCVNDVLTPEFVSDRSLELSTAVAELIGAFAMRLAVEFAALGTAFLPLIDYAGGGFRSAR